MSGVLHRMTDADIAFDVGERNWQHGRKDDESRQKSESRAPYRTPFVDKTRQCDVGWRIPSSEPVQRHRHDDSPSDQVDDTQVDDEEVRKLYAQRRTSNNGHEHGEIAYYCNGCQQRHGDSCSRVRRWISNDCLFRRHHCIAIDNCSIEQSLFISCKITEKILDCLFCSVRVLAVQKITVLQRCRPKHAPAAIAKIQIVFSAPPTLLATYRFRLWRTSHFLWSNIRTVQILLFSHSKTSLHPPQSWFQNSQCHRHFYCPIQNWLL